MNATSTAIRPATTTTASPDTGAASTLRGVLADVGLPLGTYYGLHALGVGDWIALLAATATAGLRLVVVAVRTRRLSAFAALMMGVYGLGLVGSFITGDPHVMLLKDSLSTGVVGLGFLVSLVLDRPLILDAVEGTAPAKGAETRQLYRESRGARRTIRGVTAMWGIGLLAEAVLRIPLVLALPVSVGVVVSQAMTFVAIGLLVVAGGVWVKLARRGAPTAG